MDFKRKRADERPAEQPMPAVTDEPTNVDAEDLTPEQLLDYPEPIQAGWRGVWARLMKVITKSRHLLNLYGGLVLGFLVFYAMADYTAFTTAEQRPGQLIFSNTMTQLWTASFRLAFVLGASLGLLRLFWPELFHFFRPDVHDGPDMMATIKNELTPYQRLCVFLLAFFGLCALFIALLSVSLPQTISVGR